MSEEQRASSNDEDEHRPVTLLEKIATTLSVLLVGAIVTVLLMDAMHPDAPARFTVDLGRVERVGNGYEVPVTVHNRGDKSAKAVVVHLELVVASKDSVLAESDVTVDWLPGRSSREVVGMFSRSSPGEQAAVRADVRGYVIP